MRTQIHLIAIFFTFCLSSAATADESRTIPQRTMTRVQQQTREMQAVGVPEAQAGKMLRQMVQNRYTERSRVRAQQVVMEAAREGLPPEPLMSKAMEGMAKQAREEQVIAAMENVRARYRQAHRLARSLATEEDAVDTLTRDIADGMAAGMKAEDVEAVAARLRTRAREPAQNRAAKDQLAIQTMKTARTMARLGGRSADVSDTLCEAIQNRYTHQEMKQLRQRLRDQSGRGGAHRRVANRHARSIGKGGHSERGGGDSGGQGGASANGGGSGGGGNGGGSGGGGNGGGSGGGGNGGGSGGGGNGGGSGGGGNGGGSGGGGNGGGQ
jgi:hypothetical protein